MARKATNPDNIKGKGFDKHPENINMAGRPLKCPDIDEIMAKVLSEICANKLTRAENIFRKMAIKAETDVRAAEMILERSYGKIKQQTEHSGTIALPITGMQIIRDVSKVEASG